MAWWPEVESAIAGFIHRHQETLELYGYFLVMSMAPELPKPFSLIPPFEWLWEWQRRALQSVFSMRHPDLEKKTTVESVEVQTTVGKTPEKSEEKPIDASPTT